MSRKHEIVPELGTPIRNHLVFPEVSATKRKARRVPDFEDNLLRESEESVPLNREKSGKRKPEPVITISEIKKNARHVSSFNGTLWHKSKESIPLDGKESPKGKAAEILSKIKK